MAAITPTSVIRQNKGNVNSITAVFSTAADADTWASGIKGVISWVAQGTGNPATQTSAGVSAAYSNGTFTFYPGENSLSFRLLVDYR